DRHHGDAGIPAEAEMRHVHRRPGTPYRGPTRLCRLHASVSPDRRAERVRCLPPPWATLERRAFRPHVGATFGGASTCTGSTSNPASRQAASPPLRGWTFL